MHSFSWIHLDCTTNNLSWAISLPNALPAASNIHSNTTTYTNRSWRGGYSAVWALVLSECLFYGMFPGIHFSCALSILTLIPVYRPYILSSTILLPCHQAGNHPLALTHVYRSGSSFLSFNPSFPCHLTSRPEARYLASQCCCWRSLLHYSIGWYHDISSSSRLDCY